MSDNKETMKKLRDQIDDLDAQLLALINARAQCAAKIAHVKKNNPSDKGDEIGLCYRPEREAHILHRLQDQNPGPLSNETVMKLFREIMSACLALEEVLPIGFLGPAGTFTHTAAVKHFGHAVKTISLASIDEVFKQTEAKTIAYGVVPIENSTEGVVSSTLDRFVQSSLKIVGEVEVRIHHNLIGLADNLSDIKTIYSHQQSFAQCRQWITDHLPDCEKIDTSSTAVAAQLTQESPSIAAIASREAADLYKVPVLQSKIEDLHDNITRFLIIGHRMIPPSGTDKTSILVSADNSPGALTSLLEPLARHQVSMTRIESRPTKIVNWEYVFFIDIDGHCQDNAVRDALKEVENKARFFKLLGSYPSAIL